MNAEFESAVTTYLKALRRVPARHRRSFRQIKSLGPLAVDGHDVTAAILRTLKTYYDAQDEVMTFLSKRKRGHAADFFVETVLFYLKAFIETSNLPLVACSERIIRLNRGSMQPDISIWRADELAVIIECKTQLGWNRYGWKADFVGREQRIQDTFPHAKCFLVIATGKNWPGLGNDPKVGDQYFVLSKVWPTDVDFERMEECVDTPIELLFKEIRRLACLR